MNALEFFANLVNHQKPTLRAWAWEFIFHDVKLINASAFLSSEQQSALLNQFANREPIDSLIVATYVNSCR